VLRVSLTSASGQLPILDKKEQEQIAEEFQARFVGPESTVLVKSRSGVAGSILALARTAGTNITRTAPRKRQQPAGHRVSQFPWWTKLPRCLSSLPFGGSQRREKAAGPRFGNQKLLDKCGMPAASFGVVFHQARRNAPPARRARSASTPLRFTGTPDDVHCTFGGITCQARNQLPAHL
jgi:hypothetical protein